MKNTIFRAVMMGGVLMMFAGCGAVPARTPSGAGNQPNISGQVDVSGQADQPDVVSHPSGTAGQPGTVGQPGQIGTADQPDAPGQPGASAQPDASAQPGGGLADPGSQSSGYITIAAAKAAVLDNAGLAEEDVRFVRIHLDLEDGASEYEIEFICEEGEYDYAVSAVTGEILSINIDLSGYDLKAISQGSGQTASSQPGDGSSQSGDGNSQPGDGSGQSGEGNSQSASGQGNGQSGQSGQPAGGQGQAASSQPQGDTQPASSQPGSGQPADTQPQDIPQYIGNEAAKQAALAHAGLHAEDVRFAHAHLELDDGRWTYDIEFHHGSIEYDYDIDALTGEILHSHHDEEEESHHHHRAYSADITEEQAKEIALAYADVSEADAQYLKIELDYDDGHAEYEVEWYVGGVEYSCDVDALTGEVLSFEKDFD